jgi:hypothetical protein
VKIDIPVPGKIVGKTVIATMAVTEQDDFARIIEF